MNPTCQKSRKIVLHNVDLVTPEGIIEESGLVMEDGIISRIGRVDTAESGEHVDGCGQMIMPGFIDLHSDALEKYIEPRAGSAFPLPTAILEFDKTLAACGITTMYHCICFSYADSRGRELRSNEMAVAIVNELTNLHNWLRVKTRHHIRFDILNSEAVPTIIKLIEQNRVDLLSFMDHTPGQGQYRDTALYRKKMAKEWKLSEEQLDTMLTTKMEAHQRVKIESLLKLACIAEENGVVVASHDDDGPERVDWATELGAAISEFPVCHPAVDAAKERGLWTVFGAPNVLRGGSQSGNLSATEVVLDGRGDILASDYSPMSLLHAVFKLYQQHKIELHRAVQLVTLNPARAVGIDEYTGSVEVGKQADLILVDAYTQVPHVTMTFTGGQITYRTNSPGISERAA
jgi:alpha-D-ribose 1-methylphosphonate 5-triphosphate diphosphatase